jgi:hypothetical protein
MGHDRWRKQHHQCERVDRRLDEAVMSVEAVCLLVLGVDEDEDEPHPNDL